MSYFRNCLAVLAWLAYFNIYAGAMAANVNSTSVPLRIMALGASVSFGIGSTTGDSYRKDLEDLLVANGNIVEYVGSTRHGNFSDNAVEATPGFIISQIAASANSSVPKFKPNLVLIDAGTNNCNQGGTVPDAGTQVQNMINSIYKQSPGVTVVLATVLVNSVATQDSCRVNINTQYTALASTMKAAGAKFVLVDMRSSAGPLVTDLADGRHPNDNGYVKMSNVWFGGLQEVFSKGLITAAAANATSSSSSSGSTKSNSTSKASATMTAVQGAATATSSTPAVVSSKNSGGRVMRSTVLGAVLGAVVFGVNWL